MRFEIPADLVVGRPGWGIVDRMVGANVPTLRPDVKEWCMENRVRTGKVKRESIHYPVGRSTKRTYSINIRDHKKATLFKLWWM